MDEKDHALGVGKIVSNLEALEFLIRIFLSNSKNKKIEFPKPETKELPETYITNYLSLDGLIKDYNASLTEPEQVHLIDGEVKKVRDAFAHGRIFSNTESFPIMVYKRRAFGALPLTPNSFDFAPFKAAVSNVSNCRVGKVCLTNHGLERDSTRR